MAVGDIQKAFCRKCGGDRNCEVRGFHQEAESDRYYDWRINWEILCCRGCSEVFCRTVATDSESLDHDYDEDGNTITTQIETTAYWPAKSKRAKPSWMAEFQSVLADVEGLIEPLNELYVALDNDLVMLATIGVRTVFDVSSEALKVPSNLPFAGKLDELVKLGKIGPFDKDNLETLVEAGNASAHRGWLPSTNELNTIVDILEHFLSISFIDPEKRRQLDVKAKKLKAKVPPRLKKSSAPIS